MIRQRDTDEQALSNRPRKIEYYDLVVLAVPVLFAVAVLVSSTTDFVHLLEGLFVSGVANIVIIVHAMFVKTPIHS